jgi:hypothetical protein
VVREAKGAGTPDRWLWAAMNGDVTQTVTLDSKTKLDASALSVEELEAVISGLRKMSLAPSAS